MRIWKQKRAHKITLSPALQYVHVYQGHPNLMLGSWKLNIYFVVSLYKFC